MHVLIISLQQLPAFGGVNSYVMDLQRVLRQMGHTTHVLCGSDLSSLSAEQIKKVQTFKKLLYEQLDHIPQLLLNYEVGVYAFKELLKSIDIEKFDVIHSQDGIFSKASKEIYPLKPLVGTIHGSFFSELTGIGFKGDQRIEKMFRRYDNWAISYPDIVVTPSKYLDKNMLDIPKHKHVVINHGVDVDVFIPEEKIRNQTKSIQMCTAGSLVKYKGIDVLLQALTLLDQELENIHLDVYGNGPEKEKLQHYVNEHNLPVQFKGIVTRDELPETLSRYDIFVQPSRVESFGLALTEAMACGCVPVASRVGGLQEQILHGENGLLFDSENAQELCQCLKQLCKDEKLRGMLNKRARETVITNFSLEAMGQNLMNAYHAAMCLFNK